MKPRKARAQQPGERARDRTATACIELERAIGAVNAVGFLAGQCACSAVNAGLDRATFIALIQEVYDDAIATAPSESASKHRTGRT